MKFSYSTIIRRLVQIRKAKEMNEWLLRGLNDMQKPKRVEIASLLQRNN